MSMFKTPPSTNINNTYVTQEQKAIIDSVPATQEVVNQTVADLSALQSQVDATTGNLTQLVQTLQVSAIKEIHLINEKIPIIEGKINLSYEPLSNALVNNSYMIIEEVVEGYLVHQEMVEGFAIIDRVIDLNTEFYNGLQAMLSYIVEGELV